MAGEAVQTVANAPDRFREIVFGPFTSSVADQILPFESEDLFVIDSVVYSFEVASTSGTARLYRMVPASTAEDTTAEVITAARDITASMDLAAAPCVQRAATISVDANSIPDENILFPGNKIVLDVGGTLTNLAGLLITVRGRSRLTPTGG
jgi:hypothetical protein